MVVDRTRRLTPKLVTNYVRPFGTTNKTNNILTAFSSQWLSGNIISEQKKFQNKITTKYHHKLLADLSSNKYPHDYIIVNRGGGGIISTG